jgi:hypothetical protein
LKGAVAVVVIGSNRRVPQSFGRQAPHDMDLIAPPLRLASSGVFFISFGSGSASCSAAGGGPLSGKMILIPQKAGTKIGEGVAGNRPKLAY